MTGKPRPTPEDIALLRLVSTEGLVSIEDRRVQRVETAVGRCRDASWVHAAWHPKFDCSALSMTNIGRGALARHAWGL
ncbi:MAG: hypothetical protein AB7S41_09035 [Parvibaculaceae bacterium]